MKILVIGAGPAGLSSAYWSLKHGHEATVFEKEEKYSKLCGETIPTEVFKLVPLKPRPPIISNPVKGCHIYYKNKHIKEVRTGLMGYVLNKEIFLEELENAILDQGGKVLHGVEIVEIDPENGKIADSTGRIYRGDLVIDAGGKFSVSRRKNLFRGKQILVPAAQCRCKAKGLDYEKIHLNYHRDGYSWVFFKDEEVANVGVGRIQANPKKHLEKAIREKGFIKLGEIGVDSVSIGELASNFSFKRLRIAGEAAGMVFPYTGEGIRPAIYSGKLSFMESYEEEFMEKMGRDIQRGRKFLKILRSRFTDSDVIDFASAMDKKLVLKLFLGRGLPFNFKMLGKPNLIFKLLKVMG